jgi:hypothetical protein
VVENFEKSEPVQNIREKGRPGRPRGSQSIVTQESDLTSTHTSRKSFSTEEPRAEVLPEERQERGSHNNEIKSHFSTPVPIVRNHIILLTFRSPAIKERLLLVVCEEDVAADEPQGRRGREAAFIE